MIFFQGYNRIDACKETHFDFDTFRKLDDRFNDMLSFKIAKFSQVFKLTGGTSTIPNWRLKQLLLTAGFGAFAVWPTDGKLYFVLGSMGGIQDHNLLPTKFVFADAHMPDGSTWTDEYEIGKKCVLAKNDSTYMGILPIIGRHSVAQTQTELSFYLAVINSRLSNLGIAGRDGEAVAFTKVCEAIERGDISAIVDKNYLQQFKTAPFAGQAGILKDYIEYYQFDRAIECNEMGLNANWNAKRETIMTAETLLNDDTTHPFVDDMKENWQMWIDEVNEKYGDLLDNGPYAIEWASAWAENEKEHKIQLQTAKAQSAAMTAAAGGEDNDNKEGEQNETD